MTEPTVQHNFNEVDDEIFVVVVLRFNVLDNNFSVMSRTRNTDTESPH